MALIQCEECGQMVSDKATECPNCGCPITKDVAQPTELIQQTEVEQMSTKNVEEESYWEELKANIKKKPMWWKVFMSALLLCGVACFVACCVTLFIAVRKDNAWNSEYEAKRKAEEAERRAEERKIYQIKFAKTVEEARPLINNTVWHYTENTSKSDIGFWVKVEFKDGHYTNYYANPADGKWTQKGEGVYEIKEGRYSNTGERYIAVYWEGGGYLGLPCKYALILENLQFSAVSALPSINRSSFGKYDKPSYGYMEYGDYEWE